MITLYELVDFLKIIVFIQSLNFGIIFISNSLKNKSCLFIGFFLLINGINNIDVIISLLFKKELGIIDNKMVYVSIYSLMIPLLYLYIHKIYALKISYIKKLLLIPGTLKLIYIIVNAKHFSKIEISSSLMLLSILFNLFVLLLIIKILIDIKTDKKNKKSVNQLKAIISIYIFFFLTLTLLNYFPFPLYGKSLIVILDFFFINSIILFELKRSDLIHLGRKLIIKEKLTPEEYDKYLAIIKNLTDLFESTKYYRNIDITIFDVSRELDINSKLISKAINNIHKQNFNTFVNLYRIKESKKLLISYSHKNYTIEYISLETGFKSKSAFYRAFQKYEGITPGQFKKQYIT